MLEHPEQNPSKKDFVGFAATTAPEVAWERALRDCDGLLRLEKFSEAEQAIDACSKEAVRLWGESSLQQALCAERYAELHVRLGRPERAIEIYKAVCEELQTIRQDIQVKQEQSTVILSSYRMNSRQAELLLNLGRHTEALTAIDGALRALDSSELCTTPGYRSTLYLAANVSFDLSLFEDSERYLLRHLALSSHGREAIDGRLLLARTYRELDRAELALTVLEPGITDMLYAPVGEYDQPLLGALMWERGLLLKDQQHYEDSIMDHEEAYRLFARSLGPNDQQAIHCRCSLAKVLMTDGQLHRAREILTGAVESARQTFGENAQQVFIPLRLVGELHLALARKARQLEVYSRRLPPSISRDQAEMRLTYSQLEGDIEESQRAFGLIVRKDDFQLFASECFRYHLYAARQHLLGAEHICVAAEQPHHRSLIGVYSLLAKVSIQLKRPEEALQYRQKSADISARVRSHDARATEKR
jgi:tetratricopeptide (TPR) repeat protein